mgnify:CR=1 FL=1|jgi:hypothetical protein
MTKHLKENNESYLDHLKFSWNVAFHMLLSFCFLFVHGIMPFIPTPRLFSISGMTHKMKKWDAYCKIRKLK